MASAWGGSSKSCIWASPRAGFKRAELFASLNDMLDKSSNADDLSSDHARLLTLAAKAETLARERAPSLTRETSKKGEEDFWNIQVSLSQSHEDMEQDRLCKDPCCWEITRRINGCIEVGPKRAQYTLHLEVKMSIEAALGKRGEKRKLLKRSLRLTSECEGRGSGWHRPVLLLPQWTAPIDRNYSGIDYGGILREMFVDSGLAQGAEVQQVDPVNWTAPSPLGGMRAASGLLKAVLRKLREKYGDPEASTWSVPLGFTATDIETAAKQSLAYFRQWLSKGVVPTLRLKLDKRGALVDGSAKGSILDIGQSEDVPARPRRTKSKVTSKAKVKKTMLKPDAKITMKKQGSSCTAAKTRHRC